MNEVRGMANSTSIYVSFLAKEDNKLYTKSADERCKRVLWRFPCSVEQKDGGKSLEKCIGLGN
jgi:hypothetical protein